MFINVETICGCSFGVEYTRHNWVFTEEDDAEPYQHFIVVDFFFLRFVINF
jgi:hypothetical protein